MIKTAAFAESLDGGRVICHLCPADCRLTPGKHGICRSRYNKDGVLVTDNYGEAVTLNIDPIEKKPLYHFYPGSKILSTGANSCNLGCLHCQNWTISQEEVPTTFMSPQQLTATAQQYKSLGVAFTYTEPMVWFEYILDTAPLLRRNGLKVVLVTNGYINPAPLKLLLPWVDAFNIDLKGMTSRFYTHVCKGKLKPVLENIRAAVAFGAHVELTNLLIPGENDSDEDIHALVDFVASVSPSIPLHFSAYHPDYKLDAPPTPPETLLRARTIALEKLQWVYLGNVATADGTNTICPNCGTVLVDRRDYEGRPIGLKQGSCTDCGFHTNIRQ